MQLAPGTFTGLAGPEIELFKRVLNGYGGDGVEIGCLDGFSSAIILESSELRLCSIDPFVPDSMEASLIGVKERYLENVRPFENRHWLIEDYSQNIAVGWNQIIDFLFIDGDHNYEAVLRDYEQWYPYLRKDGLLAIHDSRMHRPGGPHFHPGPSQVAMEKIYGEPDRWEVVGEAFTLTLVKKRRGVEKHFLPASFPTTLSNYKTS